MDHCSHSFFVALSKSAALRTDEDVSTIYFNVRRLGVFENLNDAPLRTICRTARYERHPPNFLLFRQGQVATCWYILLSGSVFIDKRVHLPYSCFGKRSGLNYRRSYDCIVLQNSEMIVIDYPDVKHIPVNQAGGMRHASDISHVRKSVHSTSLDPVPICPSPCSFPPPNSHEEGYTASADCCPPPHLQRMHNRHPSRLATASVPSVVRVEAGPSSSKPPVDKDACFCVQDHESARIHKSQVYLNGLSSNEDTLLRVKHRARSHKSNSVAGTSTITAEGRTRLSSTASSSTNDDELHGLPEAAVDSDEDDDESCPSHDSFHELKDCVRECLEKEPGERNANDLAVLLDFMQHMSALASLPLSIKRELCMKMVFAVVSEAGTLVMQHNEKLDAWSVIVNGQVEVVRPDGQRFEYKLGDSFGAQPIPTNQYHVGEMRTLVDDCEFVLVEHRDYCNIMSKVADHIHRHSDGITGEIVSETETRRSVGSQVGQVLIKANKEKLIEHLIDERDVVVDANYADDFLLMYRTFITDPTMIFEKLMHWFAEASLRDRVARIVLLWANNHFNDFECNAEMMNLLERFERALERDQMHSQQSLLNIACSVKSRARTITYTRSSRDQPLCLSIIGGTEGIFVSDVQRGSQASKLGIKRGDQMIEVNGRSFKSMSVGRALDMLRGSTHLSITVKSNLLGFKEMISQQEGAVDVDAVNAAAPATPVPSRFTKHKLSTQSAGNGRTVLAGAMPVTTGAMQSASARSRSAAGGVLNLNSKSSVVDKLLTILKGWPSEDPSDDTVEQRSNTLRASRSNPDIASHSVGAAPNNIAHYYQPVRNACPEHVLKVYRADQSFKYLTVYRETTAQNVVQLALQEFGMASESGSLEWALCETSVTPEGVIKQRRLPDQICNLAERIQLNSRYYLKNNARSDPLVCDELAPQILKEAETQLLHLNAQVVAAQLTLQDFAVFSSIEPTEYVDNLFNLESRYGWPKLSEFETLFNKEMWWVPNEVCRERSVQKRAKLVKKLIKVARHCRDFRNFNSMFAIMSGLEKPAVRRLHHTWDRVPNKYVKMFEDMQQLVDPSRNMSKYRQHLSEVSDEPPVEMWWVPNEVCRERSVQKRAKLVKKLIKVARHCRDFRNFNSMFAIMSGLEKPAVRRLHHTWDRVPNKYVKMFEDMQQLVDPSRNMSKYRQHLSEVSDEPPVVPIYPVLKKDLTFCHEGNPTYCGRLVNFEKLRMIARAVRSVTRLCSVPYEISVMAQQSSGNGVNDALLHMNSFDGAPVKGAGQPRKKVYEQALMVRKVKSYLAALNVIESEHELDRMSLECEPAQISTAPTRRRAPSPSPSSHSNASDQRKFSAAPKFGVESPQAVQKILSLAQNSRTKSQTGGVLTTSSSTVAQSPLLPSKGVRMWSAPTSTLLQRTSSLNHTRQPVSSEVQPVDLNAESSSVTSICSP
ncbi:Rap guanine nucleotide exchange factor 2 [Toxocara canis]|uniref:Rap guanine nucleotide exchange factor 2 n=1 Tax=Toxocara canis TaxID=6265 RepID=A0A0B2VQ75_TOXCA|nr:Rap guanine nucleotide exchange factor 2 [Toxocara canis]